MLNTIFFELIQVAIGRRSSLSRMLSAEEWRTLYGLSVKQAVAGVCFCGVQRLQKEQRAEMSRELMMQWFALSEKIKQRNVLMNHRCGELLQMLDAEGVRCSILKGQGVATLYNGIDSEKTSLGLYRQSGDIDVWVDGGMTRALKWCRERYRDVDFDYINAHVPVFEDVEVEIHWRVQSMANLFKNRKLQRWLERDETKEMICGSTTFLPDGSVITVPSVEFNAFYLMLHCYNHEFLSGLGLRQLMDYYFLLENNIEKKDSVLSQFREFGMERFVSAVMWIMQEVFGQERECLLCEPDEKEGRYILEEVMKSGNFGQHDKRIKKVGKGKWQSVFASLQHALHVLRRYPSEALWMPVWMVCHFVWKRTL